jgi:hypothetical protein
MPINRPSKRIIPRPGRGRRESRPNVYVQGEAPRGMATADSPDGASPVASAADLRRRQTRARAGAPRSEVFTRTLDKELRLIGVLTAVSVVVVIAARFVLE